MYTGKLTMSNLERILARAETFVMTTYMADQSNTITSPL